MSGKSEFRPIQAGQQEVRVTCKMGDHPKVINGLDTQSPIMSTDRNTRIELSPLAHTALLAEAATRRIKPKSLMEELIFAGISDKTRAYVGIDYTNPPAEIDREKGTITLIGADEIAPITQKTQKPIKQKPRIDKTPELVERVKALWGQNTRTVQAIANEIGYSKSTTAEAIKRMKASGVLKE